MLSDLPKTDSISAIRSSRHSHGSFSEHDNGSSYY